MKKFIINSLAITLVFGLSAVANAEETATVQTTAEVNVGVNGSTSGGTTKPKPPIIPAQLKQTREAIKDVREEAKDKIQDLRVDVRAKLGSTTDKDARPRPASSTMERRDVRKDEKIEDRRENIIKMIGDRFKKMFLRLQATIDREKGIMEKINTRISKVKAEGGNTAEAEKYTAEAKISLDSAQNALNLLKSSATSSTTIDAQLNASTTGPKMPKEAMERLKKISGDVEKHLKAAHKSLESSVKSLKGMRSAKNPNVNATTTLNATTTGSI